MGTAPGLLRRAEPARTRSGQIDLNAVSSLITTGKAPISSAAAQLGTSTGHIRFALERVPRPVRDWGPGALPAAGAGSSMRAAS